MMAEDGRDKSPVIAKTMTTERRSFLFKPYGKTEWIAAIKKIYKNTKDSSPGLLQKTHPYLYDQGVWIFGDADDGLRAAGFDPEITRLRSFWTSERLKRETRRLRQDRSPLR